MEKITKSAGAMYLSRDDEAPMLYAVWLHDDILGAGDTAEQAIAEARATILGWKRRAECACDVPGSCAICAPVNHANDEDCYAAGTVDKDGTCSACGVVAGFCPDCCGTRYHRPGCPESDAATNKPIEERRTPTMTNTTKTETISATHDTYTIAFSNGRKETIEGSYQDALDYVRGLVGADVEIGHDGDLSDGGDRTLFWASEEDSIDDDGARALGSISSAARDSQD